MCICVCRIYIFFVRIILRRLQYRSNSASQNQNIANTLQFPLYRNDGYYEADCLYGWTLWTLLVGFSTNSGWQFDCERRSDPANLQRYLKLCSVPMKWNKLNWEIPLSLSLFLCLFLSCYDSTLKSKRHIPTFPLGVTFKLETKLSSVMQENWTYLNIHDPEYTWNRLCDHRIVFETFLLSSKLLQICWV